MYANLQKSLRSILDYARQHAIDALKTTRTVVFVTSGPAGVQASASPCEANGLDLYLLVPQTSDHLFNLEFDSMVILLTPRWELKGHARVMRTGEADLNLQLLRDPEAAWCVLVRVDPYRMQIRREAGWGYTETIDLGSG